MIYFFMRFTLPDSEKGSVSHSLSFCRWWEDSIFDCLIVCLFLFCNFLDECRVCLWTNPNIRKKKWSVATKMGFPFPMNTQGLKVFHYGTSMFFFKRYLLVQLNIYSWSTGTSSTCFNMFHTNVCSLEFFRRKKASGEDMFFSFLWGQMWIHKKTMDQLYEYFSEIWWFQPRMMWIPRFFPICFVASHGHDHGNLRVLIVPAIKTREFFRGIFWERGFPPWGLLVNVAVEGASALALAASRTFGAPKVVGASNAIASCVPGFFLGEGHRFGEQVFSCFFLKVLLATPSGEVSKSFWKCFVPLIWGRYLNQHRPTLFRFQQGWKYHLVVFWEDLRNLWKFLVKHRFDVDTSWF